MSILTPPMQILLTNDDGIMAPGILAMYRELVKLGDVTVIAPNRCKAQPGTALHSPRRY